MNKKKVILITGASSGIGAGLVRYYIACDYLVVGLSRKPDIFSHKNYSHFTCDISNETEVKEFFKIFKSSFKSLDILINNAGALTALHSAILPVILVEEMLNINILGTFLMTREAIKIMQKSNFGRIINISSMADPIEPVGDSIYAATKAAINKMSNIMAKEYAGFGITSNTIMVSYIPTKMSLKLDQEKIQTLLDTLPIKQTASYKDIANIINFLILDESNLITSQCIGLNGIHP